MRIIVLFDKIGSMSTNRSPSEFERQLLDQLIQRAHFDRAIDLDSLQVQEGSKEVIRPHFEVFRELADIGFGQTALSR
jgi:hypothetical protein